MMEVRQIPYVEVSGTHREMGRQIGEASREQVRHSIENTRNIIKETYGQLLLSWEGALIQAQKYLLFVEERYPQYIEEMHGIAEGSNVAFQEIAMLNVIEGITADALHLNKCTSFAVNQECTANENVLVSHNEDWLPEDEPDVFIVHATPNNEVPYLAMTYGGLLPNVGFNAEGIAQCCNSVYPNDCRVGIPRGVVARSVLAARTISEAIHAALIPQRSAGYNHLICHESGEIYSIEASALQFAVLYAENGYMVHTNHYISPQMLDVENAPEEAIGSRVRYFRAQRLIKATPKHTLKTLQAIQKDHVNYPDSICNHFETGSAFDRSSTITALVIDLESRQMFAAWGNPCTSIYTTFQLKG